MIIEGWTKIKPFFGHLFLHDTLVGIVRKDFVFIPFGSSHLRETKKKAEILAEKKLSIKNSTWRNWNKMMTKQPRASIRDFHLWRLPTVQSSSWTWFPIKTQLTRIFWILPQAKQEAKSKVSYINNWRTGAKVMISKTN